MTANTGWRALAPEQSFATFENFQKSDLFGAARDASIALDLAKSTRFLLNQLVGFFGQAISGRALVWPSNAVLVERTGLSERQVRYSIRELIENRILVAKDSANGKRYAVKSTKGQIIDAFGLDLTPLLSRWQEFKIVLEQKRTQKAAEKRLREEVTITRRTIEEALSGPLCASSFNDMTKSRMQELRNQPAGFVIAAWRSLLAEVLAHIHDASANDGTHCRHKETNNDGSDQSCNNGSEGSGANFTVEDVVSAVPGALAFVTRPVRSFTELIEAAATVRGSIGAHRSAWQEACDGLGSVNAAAAVMVVAEIYVRDVAGEGKILNPGGYFRAYVRLLLDRRISLPSELRRLARHRAR